MMTYQTSQIKVIKEEGDFKRAMECGFAVNLHNCSDSEMWIVLPIKDADMRQMATQYNFVPVS
jgi:hypothetical protein